MIRVNLLPHREIRRRRLQQQYFVMLGLVAFVGVAVWLLVHTSLTNSFENQQRRNQYLQAEIVKLDKEIEDIKKLKEMTASLLSRKKVVETLQSNRAEVVHLLDELTRQLPDGVYLKGIKQQGSRVTINGYTQSQARVSTLMRNLDASPYLENANLIEIRAVPLGTSRINEFTLAVNIERPKPEEDKTAKPAKTAAAGAK
ncbi:MAG: type 4 fimbrial biosis protein [Betaproteobacteria bacterium]|jgi:type IV pilus assembly protein PilN|nr:type 4 fimbrial biosis protein [Betaproteobacteria bacterium]